MLTRDAAGETVRAAIRNRPLGGALRFSAQLRERLAGVIDGDCFYDGAVVAERVAHP